MDYGITDTTHDSKEFLPGIVKICAEQIKVLPGSKARDNIHNLMLTLLTNVIINSGLRGITSDLQSFIKAVPRLSLKMLKILEEDVLRETIRQLFIMLLTSAFTESKQAKDKRSALQIMKEAFTRLNWMAR